MAQRIGGGWFAFLTMSFLIVGLTGVFATYAAPLALEREARREAAFDQVLRDGGRTPALRDALGDDLPTIPGDGQSLTARVAAARVESRLRFAEENAAIRRRLLLLIGIVTAMATLFGAFVLQAAR